MTRRILVTGIAGMLGRGVALALAEAGHRVFGFDLAPCPVAHPNIDSVSGDVRDVHRLYRAVEAALPLDGIIHAGGVSGSMVLRDNPAQIVDINVIGTANLLEVARLRAVPRVVFCSSIMAYGPVSQGPVREDRHLAPINVYGASKVAGEALIRSYSAEFGLHAVILRIAHVYGPTRTTFCPVGEMVRGASHGRPVTIPASPDTRRQFIHSDDVVVALKTAVLDDGPGCITVNIGPGRDWSLAEAAEVVRRVVGPVEVTFTGSGQHPDYQTAVLAIEAAERVLGWTPRRSFEDGLESYGASFRSSRPVA